MKAAAWLDRGRLGELVRFLTVGALSALANTLIIVALTELAGLPYTVSYWVCFVIVTLWGFVLNRTWSFGVTGGRQLGQVLRYYLVTLVATVLAFGAIRLMVGFGVVYWLACYLAAGLMAPFNFVCHRWWSFGRPAGQ